MSKVVTPYTYLDGRKLTTDHNKNIFSADGDEGIMSEPNGGLSSDNLASDFLVRKEHVHPEEVVRSRQNHAVTTMDYMSDAVGNSSSDGAFTPIAGSSVRIYLPYDTSVALWQVSLFYSSWRVYQIIEGGSDDDTIHTKDIFVKLFVDGRAMDHTWRNLPLSVPIDKDHYADADDARDPDVGDLDKTYEGLSGTGYLDLTHMDQNVSAGWHSVTAKLFMESTYTGAGDPLKAWYDIRYTLDHPWVNEISYSHRATFGFRNARVLTLL